jgi:hypothetical protein
MENLDGKQTDIDLAYEPDYEIKDVVFFEPFVVMKPIGEGRPNWWSNRVKVESLIAAFKMDLTTQEACIQTGISLTQYKYFCKIHPTFVAIKGRCKSYAPIVAKQGLVADLKNPKDSRARQWFLERKQPHIYGRDIGAYTPPPPEAASKISGEAFMDKDGKILVSKQTLEVLKKEHGEHNEGPRD